MICRNHYKTLSSGLQIFLQAINWSDPEQVREVHNMLKQWTPLSPEDALSLLDAHYPDQKVRLYAVERISTLSDDDLSLYMLELTQTLLFEQDHFSPLAEMLLERSLRNPHVVGHQFFWQLKSQLHFKPFFERYILLIEQFVMLCGSFRCDLAKQIAVNDGIHDIAKQAQENQKDKVEYAKKSLVGLKESLHDDMLFALDTRWKISDFDIESCKVLDSKKLPLWLDMKNHYSETDHIKLIFKCGDDLRQDMLTLQLFKIMDKIWLENGYDFRMKPYKVMSTADQIGMIEVVVNSDTISNIHKRYGGVMGALKSNTIWQYLKEKNIDPQSYEIATENFLKSCAGYCVTTYILGVGDRHSGNIMVTQTGHLFHIDFGHFLGNFKEKFGFKRERAPFVFTDEMAFVMGGKGGTLFKNFEDYCTQAYNLARRHGNFILSIFMLMLSAGIPQLSDISDIEYLKNQLALSLSEQEATQRFKKEILDSLNNTWRRIDNLIHSIRRGEII